MSESMLRFLIVWGPTFLFILIVLFGFIVGLIRGFRKSFILFIQMLVAFVICLTVFLCLVRSPNFDQTLVNTSNRILSKFNNSLQGVIGVDEAYHTLHEMLLAKIVMGMDEQSIMYYLVLDNAAYIYTIVDMAYRLILFILVSILYSLLVFLFYLIYLIAYPVRRKIKRHNRKFAIGEVGHPYRKKHLLGGLVGGVRALLVGVVAFSFLGSLLFIVTGGTNLPNRQEARDEEVSFDDDQFNKVYDYYSYVCELSNTGIFKVLNGIKDPSKTPFYFYISDLVFQGQISDASVGVEDKFYLRDETGAYVSFVKEIFLLMVKYSSNEELNCLISKDTSMDDKLNVLTSLMQQDGFSNEFDIIVDDFETKPFLKKLCISALTSLVNHIDIAVKDNEVLVEIVQTLFTGDDAIKVTDLATEQDVKNVFKSLVHVIATSDSDEPLAVSTLAEEIPAQKATLGKKALLYSRKLLPTIQELSLFKQDDKKEKGNTVIKKLYQYCSTKFVDETITLPVIADDVDWIDEFNIMLDIADPLLGLSYNIYDEDKNILVDNMLDMFNDSNAQQNEEYYDSIANQMARSKLVHVVFQSSLIGDGIEKMLVSMTSNEEASIPKQIDYGSGTNSEGYILLTSFKHLIKNNGKELYHHLIDSKDQISGETVTAIFDSLDAEITLADQTKTTLVDEMLKSTLLHYVLSSILYYGKFGSFQLYVPQDIVEVKKEGEGDSEKVYPVITKGEIVQICHILVDCKDVIAPLIDNPNDINYVQIFTNEHLVKGVNNSILLKGTIANILINQSTGGNVIILPAEFDHPEKWIEEQEVEAMMNSISAMSHHQTESGEVLINQLMTGTIQSSDLLGIDEDIIDSLFTSVVLRYTVSDLIQSTRTNTFEIVVPYRDYEIIDAATVTEKKVNVIKKEILGDVLKDIKIIVSFNEAGEPKMNMKQIFNNKNVLITNDVLHATMINYLILLSNHAENSSIIVPKNYQEAFEDLRSNPEARENIWYGQDSQIVENAELYLLLDFIEGCIEDSEGNIPDDFDMEQDFSNRLTIRNTEDNMRDICTSALINATISKKIVETMPTPAHLYQNQIIDEAEMRNLLSDVFLILEKNEITVSDFENFNTEQIIIKESMVEPLIKSLILCSTVSKYMIDSEYVVVPKASVYETVLVDQTNHFIVHHTEDNNELKSILNALIDVFGKMEEGDTEKSVAIQNIKTEDLIITQEMKEKVRDSIVLQASLSYHLIYKGQNNVIVPHTEEIIERIDVVSIEESIYMIEINELIQLLNVGIHLFGDGNSLKISEMKSEHIMVHKNQVHLITQSIIMNTTIMDGMLDMDEMVIPRVNGKISAVARLEYDGVRCLKIDQNEIEYLLSTLIDVLGTESQIDTSEIQTNRMFITKDIDVSRSEILAATLGSKILATQEFNVPMDCMSINTEIVKKSLEISTKDLIQTSALKEFMDGLFSLVDHVTIAYGKSDINMDEILLTKESMPIILNSAIFEATISEKLFIDALYIPDLSSVVQRKDYYEKPDQLFIESQEMINLWDAVFAIFNSESLSMNDIKDTSRIKMIHKSKQTIDAILNSYIIKTTISKGIYDASALEKLPRDISEMGVMNGSSTVQYMPLVIYREVELFIPSIFELTPGEILDLNNLSINQIILPKQLEQANQFVESDIITATMSKQVLEIESNKIIILDSCLELDQNYAYISKLELAKLLIGLSVGLSVEGLDSVSSFDTIAVPKTEEQDKIDAMMNSEILRATISNRVLSSNTVAIQQGSSCYTEMIYHDHQVAVLSSEEINRLITGINLLGGDFENISLSVTAILTAPNKTELLQIIAASNIYCALMSKELTREILSTKIYLTLFSPNESEMITIDGEVISYSYQSYMGKYIIQNPEENVAFYIDFEMNHIEYQYMFTRSDIIALEYVTLTSI